MSWTIYHDGSWKTFETLGIAALRRTLLSQDDDTVEFIAPGADFDGDPLFNYGDDVLIRRDNEQWFLGKVISTPRAGSARSESIAYRLAGPWFWLDNLVFQQSWNYADGSGETVSGRSTHVFLGQKIITDPGGSGNPAGAPQTTAEQITEILQWAIDCGAPLQIGTLLTGINVPIREGRDMTCGEALRQMLRWHPDAVTWFDYSTTPPTLHCGKRGDLQALSLAIGGTDGTGPSDVSITPRHDLQVPAVILKFERTDTDQPDGIARTIQTTQVAPVGATEQVLGALIATIDLQGATANWLRAVTTTATIDALNANATLKKAWWKAKLPWLNDARIVDFSISDAARSGSNDYPRELLDGQITEWMIAQGAHVEDEEISCKLTLQYANATSKNNDADEVVSVKVKATDIALGDKQFLSLQTFISGEDEPAGLADSIYAALSALQYEGQVTLHEQEVNGIIADAGITGSYGLGCVLNLTGGRSEWGTMRALITGVTEEVTTGITTLTFGPAQHLGIQDLIELLRMTRTRINYTAPTARVDPQASARSELGLGKHLPRGQANSGAPSYTQFWTVTGSKSVQQDTTGDTAKLEVKETTTANKIATMEATATAARSVLSDGSKTCERNTSHLPSWVRANDMKYRECRICLTIGGTPTQMKICGEFSLAYDEATGKYYDPATATEVTS